MDSFMDFIKTLAFFAVAIVLSPVIISIGLVIVFPIMCLLVAAYCIMIPFGTVAAVISRIACSFEKKPSSHCESEKVERYDSYIVRDDGTIDMLKSVD